LACLPCRAAATGGCLANTALAAGRVVITG
jgi:hypothetical protein